jgi:hypothetical protein
VWWNTPVIPALGKLKQEDPELRDQPELYSKTLSQKQKKKMGWWSGSSGTKTA